jgi:hypothetical protein
MGNASDPDLLIPDPAFQAEDRSGYGSNQDLASMSTKLKTIYS